MKTARRASTPARRKLRRSTDLEKFAEVRLTDLSKITHSYHVVHPRDESSMPTLIVRFSGRYARGCRGNGDATYMTAVSRAGLEAWQPPGLVLDLRELHYTWGDRLTSVLRVGEGRVNLVEAIFLGKATTRAAAEIPTAVVVSHRCREGLHSLLRDELHRDPAAWIFGTLAQAVASVANRTRSAGSTPSPHGEPKKTPSVPTLAQ